MAALDILRDVMNDPQDEAMRQSMGGLSRDLKVDYESARARLPEARQAVDDAVGGLQRSFMEGYDPNAYDAQAWAQAGIGAATPTISALESLNRAVAGYSGVKLQQRADYGKRLQAEKEAKLQAEQAKQKLAFDQSKNASDQLIDLYKAGKVSKSALLQALADRYVNVQGRGLVDKFALATGQGNPIAVDSLQPAIMYQKLLDDVTKEAEQDKNMHFASDAERSEFIRNTTANRWKSIAAASGGVLPADPFAVPQVPGMTPQDQAPAPAPSGAPSLLDKPLPAEQMGYAPGEVERTQDPNYMAMKPIVSHGITTDPNQPAPPAAKVAPWSSYTQAPGQIFDKVQQERSIAQNAQAEKNAEEQYAEIAKSSEATSQWYDTLRELDATDLSATGSFANIRNSAGKLLETMGYPDAAAAADAKNLSKINNLLMQGIQSRLSVQNGVQAKDDATRETQSFAQMTDPKNVFKALVAQAKAKSLRTIEKEEFWRNYKQQNGTYEGATSKWNDYIKQTPIFAMYGGKPVYYNQFIDAFLARNAETFDKQKVSEQDRMQEALKAWRSIAGRK